MSISFGRVLTRRLLSLTRAGSPAPCRLRAINRFTNPLKAATIGIRFESSKTRGRGKASSTATTRKRAEKKKPVSTKATAVKKKKTAAKKPAAKRTAAKRTATKKKKAPAKKSARGTTASKKSTKRKAAKKPLVKKKKKKVELTPKQKTLAKIKQLRKKALDPPRVPMVGGYGAYITISGSGDFKGLAASWNALSSEQKAEYAEKSKALRAAALTRFKEWLESTPAADIYTANLARKHLARLGIKSNTAIIRDPRKPKLPAQPYSRFIRDMWRSGRFQNPDGTKSTMIGAVPVLKAEWEALSDVDKKPYIDAYLADREAYEKAKEDVYGFRPKRG